MVALRLRLPLSCLVAGVIGGVAWNGNLWLIAATPMIPVLVLAQSSRAAAGAVAFSYYGAASWPLMAATRSFLDLTWSSPWAPLIWLTASTLLAVPWLLVWTANISQVPWRAVAAFVLSVIPPLGLIGWASPLTAAGILFPGTGWFGLAATAFLPQFLVLKSTRFIAIAATLILALDANLRSAEPATPAGWVAENTHFKPLRGPDPQVEFAVGQAIRHAAARANGDFVVFPEGAVRRWTEATEAFWEPTVHHLAASSRTLLIGAGLPVPASSEYRNAVVIVGAHTTQPFLQRIPIPVAMWKPLDPSNSVPLRLSGPGIVRIAEHTAAILI